MLPGKIVVIDTIYTMQDIIFNAYMHNYMHIGFYISGIRAVL